MNERIILRSVDESKVARRFLVSVEWDQSSYLVMRTDDNLRTSISCEASWSLYIGYYFQSY